jgi:hypothetical protein
MKKSIIIFGIFCCTKASAGLKLYSDTFSNPLASYSSLWDQSKFKKCNTASDVSYLNDEEKRIIWVLNMLRLDPRLFVKTVLLNPKFSFYQAADKRNFYYQSLISDLNTSRPITVMIIPDSLSFESAKCHAYSSGQSGYVGHERISKSCIWNFAGECCDYGYNDALSILSHLLIDKDVPDLGHRKICLSDSYTTLGPSIQPHRVYGYNTVLDFK